MSLLLQFQSYSFPIAYRHQTMISLTWVVLLLTIGLFLNFWRIFEILKKWYNI